MRISAILFFVFTILTPYSGEGQDHAITTRGDTLRGAIKMFNFGAEKKIQVAGTNKSRLTLPIFQVRSFVIDNDEYRPVKGPSGYAFMKVIKDGYLSLYAFQLPNQTTFDGLFLSKKDGSGLEVPGLNFKRAMKNFMEECPGTVSKIEDGTFGRKDLDALVDHYNDCIQSKSQPASKPAVVTNTVPPITSSSWTILGEKVSSMNDFQGKSDALEMIAEIQSKISKSEKVPNFMIEGLRSTLKDKGVENELNTALQDLK
jgi:hypothetical protein